MWWRARPLLHTSDQFREIRAGVRSLCAGFPDEYFRQIDADRGYPDKFVRELMKAGWLAAMIPEDYGGSGLGLAAASVIMEEIHRSGGNAGAVHRQMDKITTLLPHSSHKPKATNPPPN